MVKTILAEMKKYADEEERQQNEQPSLSSLAIEDEPASIKRIKVLLDGGASHNVFFGSPNTGRCIKTRS